MADKENSMLRFRKFYLTIESAKNVPNVRRSGEAAAYAQVLVGSPAGKTTESKTKVAERKGANPVWNQAMEFLISEEGVQYYGLSLAIKLYAKRTIGPDGYIGEVNTTIKELYDQAFADGGTGSAKCELPIKNGTEEMNATLKFCYSFNKDSYPVEKNFMEKAIQIALDTINSAVRLDRESSTDENKNEFRDAAIKMGMEAAAAARPIVVPAVIALVIAL